MKYMLAILLFFASCAGDNHTYNIDALKKEHLPLFKYAMNFWNWHNANAAFEIGSNGPSDIVYGNPKGDRGAEFLRDVNVTRHGIGDRIVLEREYTVVYLADRPDTLCGLMLHELGHNDAIYGKYHSDNPAHPMYPIPPPCDLTYQPWNE